MQDLNILVSKKQKFELKEIELSYCRHLICFQKTTIKKKERQKTPKKILKWPYLKAPICPRVIYQKACSSYIFQ